MRTSFLQQMVIQFSVGDKTCHWNLMMARIIFQLWEIVQLHAINLPFDMAGGDYSQKFIQLSDYRMSRKYLEL